MKICIDSGHGTSNRQHNVDDSGATHVEGGTRHDESAIALKNGLTLKDAFRAWSVSDFMTRDDGTDHAAAGRRAGASAFTVRRFRGGTGAVAAGLDFSVRRWRHAIEAEAGGNTAEFAVRRWPVVGGSPDGFDEVAEATARRYPIVPADCSAKSAGIPG